MPHPSRRLLILPFLLLVPLGVLKWRADHPPLSEMDVDFHAAIAQASWVQIAIEGPVIKGDGEVAFDIRDKALMQQLTSVLRCKEGRAVEPTGQRKSSIVMYVVKSGHEEDITRFSYSRHEQGNVLQCWRHWNHSHGSSYSAAVQGNFASRFEALMAQLARRAVSPDEHPDVVRVGTT